MEAIIFTSVFVFALAAYVALHARAGLAEDAQWSRQLMLTGHGVHLGLSAREWEVERPPVPVAPIDAARGAAATAALRPQRSGAPGQAVLAGGVPSAQLG